MPHDMDDRLDQPEAAGWKPKPGDKIVGTVIEKETRNGGYDDYDIVTVEKGDGEAVAIHAFHEVLASKLKSVTVGETIGVKYIGPPSGDRNYYAYKVVRDTIAGNSVGSGAPEPPSTERQQSDVPADLAPPGRVPADDGPPHERAPIDEGQAPGSYDDIPF